MKNKILIYDDDEEILFLFKIILSKYDYELKTMFHCDNILYDIETFNPHLIIMDLWIPVIGGEKTVEIIKHNEKTKNIPVILCSANEDIIQICEKVNADGCIKKPFKVSDFIETVQKTIT